MNLGKVRDVAVTVGLLVSGGLWLARLRFYDELGIAPGDVGIGFGQVLERSIGALAVIAVLLPTLAVIAMTFGVPVVSLFWRETPPGNRFARIERPGASPVRPGEWVLSGWIPVAFVSPILLMAVIPIPDLVTLVSVGTIFAGMVLIARGNVIVVKATVARVGATTLALATAVGAFALFRLEAGSAARQVKNGVSVEREFLGVTTLGIRAQPTDVEIRGVKRCVLYLGSADGVTVLYDPEADAVERIPSGDLRLTLDRDRERCR